jgi:hypothetical protein
MRQMHLFKTFSTLFATRQAGADSGFRMQKQRRAEPQELKAFLIEVRAEMTD